MKNLWIIMATVVGLSGCVQSPNSLRAWEPILGERIDIIHLSQADVQRLCEITGGSLTPPGYMVHGCVLEIGQVLRGDTCTIFINGELWVEDYKAVLEHEKAHCRGWNHGDPKPRGAVG